MIYEFITPSDPITFKAESPAVAFFCALILGNGKAFATGEDDQKLPCCLMFADKDEVDATIKDQLGGLTVAEFESEHAAEIVACFESFSYGNFADRRDYDAALEAITEPAKMAAFKAHHEDQRRTSMSAWVKAAWKTAEAIRRKFQLQEK